MTNFMDTKKNSYAASTQNDPARSFTPAQQSQKDSRLLIKNPAPDASPPKVSNGTYSEGTLRR